jgi:predicted nucleotidyltransferase component of viral defense system
MTHAVQQMLARYDCKKRADYEQALKEIVQEIILVGLWRAKFFEHAAFYGGTALRILHGLPRFSEDLDFSLDIPNPDFALDRYFQAIQLELESLAFTCTVSKKVKRQTNPVQSAFLKMNTLQGLLQIGVERSSVREIHPEGLLKIKFEIDTDPPGGATTEALYITQPVPASIRTYVLPDSFAGKVHAALCREWGTRVKGRDWYDLLWFVNKQVPLHLQHLEARMRQSGALEQDAQLTELELRDRLSRKVESLDLEKAIADVLPFISDPREVEGWSRELFHQVIQRIPVI